MDSGNADFLRTVIEHTPEHIFVINRKAIITVAPKQANKHLQKTSILSLIGPAHVERFRTAISDALQSDRPVNCDVKGTFGSGKTGWFSCRISPITDDGKTDTALVFASDITERRIAALATVGRERQKNRSEQDRLRAVENILTMCAQTHKVRVQGEWMTIEAFLWKRYGFKISHGLCPEAATELLKTLVTETPCR